MLYDFCHWLVSLATAKCHCHMVALCIIRASLVYILIGRCVCLGHSILGPSYVHTYVEVSCNSSKAVFMHIIVVHVGCLCVQCLYTHECVMHFSHLDTCKLHTYNEMCVKLKSLLCVPLRCTLLRLWWWLKRH